MEVRLRVDEILKEKRFTLRKLAAMTGLSTQALSGMKNHKSVRIELKTIGLLCKALDCKPSNLFKISL